MTQATEMHDGTLWTANGQEQMSINDYLLQLIPTIKKPLFWLEPALQINDNGSTGRLHDFTPFTGQLPEKLPQLEAAYVFGFFHNLPMGVHLITTPTGCRWFSFSVNKREGAVEMTISQRSYPALTRRDFARFFGHHPAKVDKKLEVTEYWHESGLLTWWIGKGEA